MDAVSIVRSLFFCIWSACIIAILDKANPSTKTTWQHKLRLAAGSIAFILSFVYIFIASFTPLEPSIAGHIVSVIGFSTLIAVFTVGFASLNDQRQSTGAMKAAYVTSWISVAIVIVCFILQTLKLAGSD